MKVIELVQKLQALGQPNLEVVGSYPEFDYPYSVEGVRLAKDRSPDELDTAVVVITLGDN